MKHQESSADPETVTPISVQQNLTKNYSDLMIENTITIAESECRLVNQLIFAKTHKPGSNFFDIIINKHFLQHMIEHYKKYVVYKLMHFSEDFDFQVLCICSLCPFPGHS